MNPCRHRSRAEAMVCPFFRAAKVEQIFPLHGANAFTWQLTLAQDAILGSIAYLDPWPANVADVFTPIRRLFEDDTEYFAQELFDLRALGLVWVDCDSGTVGYTVEGRDHIQAELDSIGTSLQQLRLDAQAEAPGIFTAGDLPLYDRVTACLGDREQQRMANLMKSGNPFWHTWWVQ